MTISSAFTRRAAVLGASGLLLTGVPLIAASAPAGAAPTGAARLGSESREVGLLVGTDTTGGITISGKFLTEESSCTSGQDWSVTFPGPTHQEVVSHFDVDVSPACRSIAVAAYTIRVEGARGRAVLAVDGIPPFFHTECASTASIKTQCDYSYAAEQVDLVVNKG